MSWSRLSSKTMMKTDILKEILLKNIQTPLIATVLVILLSLGLLTTLWGNIQAIWLPKSENNVRHFIQRPRISVQQLAKYHLLGAYATDIKDLPLASLGVTLIGIFADNKGHSAALITLSGGNSNVYHVGDPLATNVNIVKILPHSVIVKHNGRLEKLEMPIQPIEFKNELPQSGLWNKST